MRDVDILNGVRRVVASDGKICIAGFACNFRYFAENYLSENERTEAKNFLHDERGREVKIFLGYAFKGDGVPDVSYSKLWQMFKKTLVPEWNYQTVDTVIVPYESCSVKSVAEKQKLLDKKFYPSFYPSNESMDVGLFEQCLAARKDFCSNVDAVKIAEEDNYEIITAPQSVIDRLEAQKKTPPQQPQQSAVATPQEHANQATRQDFRMQRNQSSKASKEKGSSTVLILLAAVVVIAMILFVIVIK